MQKFLLPVGLGIALLGASCARMAAPKHPKPVPETREAPVTLGAPQKEESPERSASNSLIEEGKAILERGSLDRAGDVFQEAVSVDPNNGIAYYYLALVKFKGGEYGGVWGFLEKAKALLSRNPDWMAKLKELQAGLEQQQKAR